MPGGTGGCACRSRFAGLLAEPRPSGSGQDARKQGTKRQEGSRVCPLPDGRGSGVISNFVRMPRFRRRGSFKHFRTAVTFMSRALAWIAGFFLLNTAYAIDPNRAMSQYVRDHWGAEQGFPPGPVYAIAQTPDGYLWIGTEAGLVRFDGWNFRVVKDDSGAFTITSVLGLATDNDNGLWIRAQDLTVLRYRNGVFDKPVANPEAYANISAMSRTVHGELLVSKMEEGAFNFRGGGFQMLAPASDSAPFSRDFLGPDA